MESQHGNKKQIFCQAQELRVHIFNYKQETARANLKWCKSFESAKSIPNAILPLARPHYLTLPKQPPTRDQVFKLHVTMWNILTQMTTNALCFLTAIYLMSSRTLSLSSWPVLAYRSIWIKVISRVLWMWIRHVTQEWTCQSILEVA